MAFSISIGDAIMLSKIAMQLGQAFTSGRKSAQAEFLEVQNLLYTLSKGLEMLARQMPDGCETESKGPPNQASDKDEEMTELNHIIANCRETLYHLESVVTKYSVLDAQIVETRKSRMRRWNDELFKNWKKVIWTTKGGDIGILKVTLTAHINGLNLVVSILNRYVTLIILNIRWAITQRRTDNQETRQGCPRASGYDPYKIRRDLQLVYG
jgi:hypothetical protein